MPGNTSYQDHGFSCVQITANEAGNAGRSTLSNLAIKGTSLASITPNGNFISNWYADASNNPLDPITIAGTMTFTVAGTSQVRPSWNFLFLDPKQPVAVPEPGMLSLLGLGLAGPVAARRRRA